MVVSNSEQNVPHFGQRAAAEARDAVVWDYHVYLLSRSDATSSSQIWDIDTTFGFPIRASEYLARTYPNASNWPEGYRPLFRVAPAANYCEELCSDRSHMLDDDGHFLQPPPLWPTISVPTRGSNLHQWIDMHDTTLGDVLTLAQLLERVSE